SAQPMDASARTLAKMRRGIDGSWSMAGICGKTPRPTFGPGVPMRKARSATAFACRGLLAIGMFAAPVAAQTESSIVLQPDRVFDGAAMHEGWAVLVRGERIVSAG